MFKLKPIAASVFSLSLGLLCASYPSFATDTYDNKKTTTIEQTTTQTSTTAPKKVVPRTPKKATPVTTTTSNTTTLTTKSGDLRLVLDEDALKKMSDTLCVDGFKSYVGNDKKNVCQSKATVPDIAYSCVWKEEGNAAYAPTDKGPCRLDYSEHQQSITVTKNDFSSSPPLPYGSEAQCCFRAAQGPTTSTVETSPTTVVVEPVKK